MHDDPILERYADFPARDAEDVILRWLRDLHPANRDECEHPDEETYRVFERTVASLSE